MATPKFQKGNSGKPKGAIHKATNHFLQMKSLAANDYKTAYELLWENMKIGEGWAFQIFFKHQISYISDQRSILEAKKEKEGSIFEVMSNEQIKLIMNWYQDGKAAKEARAVNVN